MISAYRKVLHIKHSVLSLLSYAEQRMRTPSPSYIRPASGATTYLDDPTTENSASARHVTYDNRPIKPLDQNMLQAKLNQYPVDK